MKCFPFKGAALTNDTLVSELSDRLLSALNVAFWGKMAATRSGAGVAHSLSVSVTAAIGGARVPFFAFARRASARVRTL